MREWTILLVMYYCCLCQYIGYAYSLLLAHLFDIFPSERISSEKNQPRCRQRPLDDGRRGVQVVLVLKMSTVPRCRQWQVVPLQVQLSQLLQERYRPECTIVNPCWFAICWPIRGKKCPWYIANSRRWQCIGWHQKPKIPAVGKSCRHEVIRKCLGLATKLSSSWMPWGMGHGDNGHSYPWGVHRWQITSECQTQRVFHF